MKLTKKAKAEFLKAKLAEDDRWALRALEVVYARQTMSEQNMRDTHDANGVGFTAFDAEILSSFAEQFEVRHTLSLKQKKLLHKKIPKYWKQVLAVSNEEKLVAAMAG